MTIVSPASFEGILGSSYKFGNQPIAAQQAANSKALIDADALRDVAKINARSALDQIGLSGERDRAARLLEAELTRRSNRQAGLLNFAVQPLGGTQGGSGGRFAGAALEPMFSTLLQKVAPRSPAEVLGDFNSFGEQVTRGRQNTTLWAQGSANTGAISGLGWSSVFGQ